MRSQTSGFPTRFVIGDPIWQRTLDFCREPALDLVWTQMDPFRSAANQASESDQLRVLQVDDGRGVASGSLDSIAPRIAEGEAVVDEDGEEQQETERDEEDAEDQTGTENPQRDETPDKKILPFAPSEVRGLDYGYGVEGATIQTDSFVQPQYTDRRIMQKTLLTGLPMVNANIVCQNIRSSNKTGKKLFAEKQWLEVMTHGLKDCTVATFTNKSIRLSPIPNEPQERIEYSNELMRLCRIDLQSLLAAMADTKKRKNEATTRAATRRAGTSAERPARSRSPPLRSTTS